MTATVPRRGPFTPVGGPSLIRRHSIVYGFPILDPATMVVRTDYVGQTVQALQAREDQHRGRGRDPDKEQPWSDLIVGRAFVIEEGWWTAAELDERERFHIARLAPRYNYCENLHNPNRIPVYVARQQRAERDRARGVVSRWTAPAPVTRRPLPLPSASHIRTRRLLTSRWTWWATAWLIASVLAWWGLSRLTADDPLPLRWHLGLSAALPPTLLGLGWWWWRSVGRRRWRKVVRWLT